MSPVLARRPVLEAGPVVQQSVVVNELDIAGFELHHAEAGSARWQRGLDYVLAGLADGWLELPIEGVYDLEDCRDAQRRLEDRGVAGKLLLGTGAGGD